MIIEKAIEILRATTQADERDFPLVLEDAMRLGIEALKSVRTGRKVGLHYEAKCLPGETEK